MGKSNGMKMKVFLISLVAFVIFVGKCDATKTARNHPGTIDVGAFNVRVFGLAKMRKTFVVQNLIKIILRYDLILIQEIRDSSQTAIYDLLNKVNAQSSINYKLVLSPRLGRSRSKEQYGYIYNSGIFSVTSQYLYDDSAKDVFSREPYVVQFSSNFLFVKTFIVIGIHTAPGDAPQEIDHLVDVYDDAKKRLGITDALIMGDFNGGCTYVTDWTSIRLANDRRFYWVFNDVTDTTSSDTECPYDRIVIAGDKMMKAIDPLSAEVFHFDREYKLTKTEALRVSDHYPVSIKIKTADDVNNIDFTRKFEIKDITSSEITSTTSLSSILSGISNMNAYSIEKNYDLNSDLKDFVAEFQPADLAKANANLDKAKSDFGSFITKVQIGNAKRHLKQLSMVEFLPKNNGHYYTLKDHYIKKAIKYIIGIKCSTSAPQRRCIITVEVVNGI